MSAHKIVRLVILVILFAIYPWQLGSADGIPARANIDGVVGYAQKSTLSCESRSAVDWAAFWGVRINERKFQSKLPRSDNPDRGFVGNPNGVWGNIPPASYGVHAEPVAALLGEYGFEVQAQRGLSWKDLRAEIAAGRPVIVWVVGQMWRGTPVKYKPSKGRKTTVARFEHTMILIGYTPRKVQVVDAYTGRTQTYPLQTFLASWGVLGRMAITGSIGPKPTPIIPLPEKHTSARGGAPPMPIERTHLPAIVNGQL
jgi:uncharacterized protein YvpB